MDFGENMKSSRTFSNTFMTKNNLKVGKTFAFIFKLILSQNLIKKINNEATSKSNPFFSFSVQLISYMNLA